VVAQAEQPADPEPDYAAGARVADFSTLGPGAYIVRVELACAGGPLVGSATTTIDLSGARAVTHRDRCRWR
jgi:hypothetical protein